MITTHILDLSSGKPAAGVRVTLSRVPTGASAERIVVGSGVTDADGRLRTLVPGNTTPDAGVYELIFETEPYFNAREITSFYPRVTVSFHVRTGEKYHVPLLISPFGYSTYRGS
jgi:5-hydroxyisourate hydrolase